LPCSPCLRGGEQTSSTPDDPRRVVAVEPPPSPAMPTLGQQASSSVETNVGASPESRSFNRGKSPTIEILSADDSGLLYEQSYRFNLERARKGVEKFKELYASIKDDNKWKDALVSSQVGFELQALYLGIKPYGNFMLARGGELTLPLEIIKDHLPDHLEGSSQKLRVRSHGSRTVLQKILKMQKEYFSDYNEEEPINSYLSRRGSPYVPYGAGERPVAQSGFLFGYPPNDAKKYAKYDSSWQRVLYAAGDAEYKDKNTLAGQFLREGQRDENFLNTHQQAIYDIIDKYASDVIEGTKEYVIGRRKVSLRGFVYHTDDPQSDENGAFAQRVNNAFEQSGMNDFIKW